MISPPIILIGPVRAGKTTLARLLANSLDIPHISLDEVRWQYYREIGYDADLAKRIRAEDGFLAMIFYRWMFDAYSVERVVSDYPQAVIDFGAGIGPFESLEQFGRVQRILTPLPNVFLILPSPDMEESLTILRDRDVNPPADLHFDLLAHFLRHPGYRTLAKHTIYNHDKSPTQSCSEIIDLLK